MVPHQSHEGIMKIKLLNPQELGRMKREAEERRLQELQKRRQIEIQQRDLKLRLMHAHNAQAGMPGAMVNGVNNPMTTLTGMNPSVAATVGQIPIRPPGGVPNISQQGNASMMAAVHRGANGEMATPLNQAMLLLQQQQQTQQRYAAALAGSNAALANGSPPRPQSAASILSQGAMGGTPPQAQMLVRHVAMQDPNLRAQIHANAMAQMPQMPMGMPADQVCTPFD